MEACEHRASNWKMGEGDRLLNIAPPVWGRYQSSPSSELDQDHRDAVGHPFLKTFKAWLDRAMGNLIQVQGWIQPWSLSCFKWVFTPDDLQKSLPAPIILWFITSWHAQNCGRVCVCAQCIWWNKVIVHLFNFFSYLIHCIWLHSNFSFIFETYGWNGALCLLKPVPAAATCIQPCPGIPSINLLMWWLAMFENNVFVYLNTGSDAYVQS